MFPQLRKIEAKYGDRLLVIGVHSPKFPAEKETANLAEAVRRYRIEHPVVNDRDFAVWNQFGGRAWPTLIFVDPAGRLVRTHEGELPFEAFDPLVFEMLQDFDRRGLLEPGRAAMTLEAAREPEHVLKFPGKVLAAAGALYVSDTNHHRIVVADHNGRVVRTIGSGHPGLSDGDADRAAFEQPQGMALGDQTLYVADTENHAIRAIDLPTGTVRTIAGTGKQAATPSSGGPGRKTDLSSPWDLVLAEGRLFIAMAGRHQIWVLDLGSGRVGPFAGTGREGLKDGPLADAWHAQPSGLALGQGHLFVADSEASAIRDIDLDAGVVSTLVGEGLFIFGDQDGAGGSVRLQHPLGIALHEGLLYVADSYNDKIKRLDPRSRQVTTWIGAAGPGSDGQEPASLLREPGGISAGGAGLYVADTNNHRVLRADWRTGRLAVVIAG